MTAKNRYKTYVKNGYYHCYNRGVEKRTIFLDEKDYKVFLSYLKFYLSPPPSELQLRGPSPKSKTTYKSQQLSNHSQTIQLIAYCLMPNHFHFLIKQSQLNSMTNFIRSLSTRYSMYFNKRYQRVGSLFQGRYKAVLIDNQQQFLYLSKYIHRNPLSLPSYTPDNLTQYPYSSLSNYLNLIKQTWLQPEDITSQYTPESYLSFVTESKELANEIDTLQNLTLDWNI